MPQAQAQQMAAFVPTVGAFAKGHYQKDGRLFTIHGTIKEIISDSRIIIDNGKRVRECCHAVRSDRGVSYQTFMLPNGKVARASKETGVTLFHQGDEDAPDYGTEIVNIPPDRLEEIFEFVYGAQNI